MRNIKEYPLIVDEVIEAVSNALDSYTTRNLIGGIDGYALSSVIEFLKDNSKLLEKHLKEKE